MAAQPAVNPNYHKVKPEADAWIAWVVRADETWASRNSRVNFAFIASMWAPTCDEGALRMMVDWMNWIFLFDDQFDEGHLSRDLEAAQEEINQTLVIMEDNEPPVRREDNIIRYVFQTTWDRLKQRTGKDQQQRWRDTHRHYFNGLLTQVKASHDQYVSEGHDVEEYMDMRRRTIAIYPGIALSEYALGINLPPEIMKHPSFEECMCVSADQALLVNDILSYKKDLTLGVEHNLILVLQSQGLSIQQAMDRIGEILGHSYKRWYRALGNMDIWERRSTSRCSVSSIPVEMWRWGTCTGASRQVVNLEPKGIECMRPGHFIFLAEEYE